MWPVTLAVPQALTDMCCTQPFPSIVRLSTPSLRLLIIITPAIPMRNKDLGCHSSNGTASTWKHQMCTQFFLVPKSMPCHSTPLMQTDPHDRVRQDPTVSLIQGALFTSLRQGDGPQVVEAPTFRAVPRHSGSPAPPPCPIPASPWVPGPPRGCIRWAAHMPCLWTTNTGFLRLLEDAMSLQVP